MFRLVQSTIAGLLLALWSASAALAAPGSGVGIGSGGRVGNVITAAVSYDTGAGSGAGSASACSWMLADGLVSVLSVGTSKWPEKRDGVTYHVWQRTCRDGVTFVEVAETTPADLLPGLL